MDHVEVPRHPNPIADLAETLGGPTEDLVEGHPVGPRVYGLRRWNRELPVTCTQMAHNRRAWSPIVRDAVNVLEDGQIRPE